MPETLYSDEELYQLLQRGGEFILAHNLSRLARFQSWVKSLKDQSAPIRRIEQGDDFDLEVYYDEKWHSINQMFRKALSKEG